MLHFVDSDIFSFMNLRSEFGEFFFSVVHRRSVNVGEFGSVCLAVTLPDKLKKMLAAVIVEFRPRLSCAHLEFLRQM